MIALVDQSDAHHAEAINLRPAGFVRPAPPPGKKAFGVKDHQVGTVISQLEARGVQVDIFDPSAVGKKS